MTELKKHVCAENNRLWYELIGDYYIPVLSLSSKEQCPIGKWGRIHREYPELTNETLLNDLILSGKLWTYLADLNEQATDRCNRIIHHIMKTEGVTEELKARDQMAWMGAMNSIPNQAEEIILQELIHVEYIV